MMTAKEAKELMAGSALQVTRFLESEVMPKIKTAAELGKSECFIMLGNKLKDSHQFDMSLAHSTASRELQKLGYTVRVGTNGDPYVPRGLDEDSPLHVNYGIFVGWH